MKKRPSNVEGGSGRGKRNNSTGATTGSTGTASTGAVVNTSVATGNASANQQATLHNGTEPPTFLKPDPLPTFSWQEYYEADEILKVKLY